MCPWSHPFAEHETRNNPKKQHIDIVNQWQGGAYNSNKPQLQAALRWCWCWWLIHITRSQRCGSIRVSKNTGYHSHYDRTVAITSPRREIFHLKTPHFAGEVHRLVLPFTGTALVKHLLLRRQCHTPTSKRRRTQQLERSDRTVAHYSRRPSA